jgi:hypothetical protein
MDKHSTRGMRYTGCASDFDNNVWTLNLLTEHYLNQKITVQAG